MIRPSGRISPAVEEDFVFKNPVLPLPEATRSLPERKNPEVINLDDFRVNNAATVTPEMTNPYAASFMISFEPPVAARQACIDRYKQAQGKTSAPGSDSNFEVRF